MTVLLVGMDELDYQIANLLVEDGRLSSAQIARKVGRITERAVRYRIDRMVKQGLIRICAIPNPQALGYPVVADVLIEVEPGHILEVARKLAEYENVSYVACSTGDSDVSIQVVAHDNAELYNFVTQVVGHVPAVRKTATFLVPIIVKDVYHWRIPASAVKRGAMEPARARSVTATKPPTRAVKRKQIRLR